MKYILYILQTLLICGASVNLRSAFLDKFDDWVEEFKMEFHDRKHFYDVLEKWITNDQYIDYVNSAGRTYQLGHNQFSGMDEFDFVQYIIKNRHIREWNTLEDKKYNTSVYMDLPASVNWVTAGAVTPVKDQGQCGSCWTFSTTGALEGIYKIKTGTLDSFSEQQLVDCDNFRHGGKDHGCNGGLMDNAFNWISKNGGLCTEDSYPYVSGNGEEGTCQTTCQVVQKSKIQSFVDVDQTDEALMSAIAQQPVSIAIEADQRDFQLYKSGVFTGTCGTNLDHGVLVVGYGTESGQDYYLVKNSWGTSWGESGYIKLGRGPQYNNGQGQCGILLEASYPNL